MGMGTSRLWRPFHDNIQNVKLARLAHKGPYSSIPTGALNYANACSDRIPNRVPYGVFTDRIPNRVPYGVSNDRIPNRVPYGFPNRVPYGVSNDRIPNRVTYGVSNDRIPNRVSNGFPNTRNRLPNQS